MSGPRRKPRYVKAKWLSGAKRWGYFFTVPSWARKRGCPVRDKALGTDRDAAYDYAETVLLPQLDSWRTGGLTDLVVSRGAVGSFDWLISVYRASKRFAKLSAGQKRNHERGFEIVANHILKDGRRFGVVPVTQITTKAADRMLETISTVVEIVDGEEVKRERRTTANHAMKSCRRAWNIAYRAHPGSVPKDNPFARMGLAESSAPTPTATYAQMLAFAHCCDGNNRRSLGTAAMIAWDWLQREEHIFAAFEVAHYRNAAHPDHALIVHPKTGESVWWPLYHPDRPDEGPISPELMVRLDAVKAERIGGLMIVRDWIDDKEGRPLPWPTGKRGDLTYMRHEVKRLIRLAGLPDDLSFRSFRHGGLTEGGDSDMTDREILAQSAQKSTKVLTRYVKRTQRQVANGALKRRATRTKAGDL